MSFILDALRRADAERERERGHLPDLHARSLSAGPANGAQPGAGPWLKVGAAVLALLLAALAGWQWRRADAPAAAPGVPAAAPEAQVAAPRPAESLATGARVPAMDPPLASPPPAVAVLPSTPVAVAAPVVVPVTPAPERRPEAAGPATDAPAARTSTAKGSEPSAAAAPASPRLAMTLDASGGALPPVKVGGVMYAETPENRVLVINDQVLREGETVQPGLVLEHIGPKSAKLRWKDQVVEVPY